MNLLESTGAILNEEQHTASAVPSSDQTSLVADLVAAYVSNNSVPPSELPSLIALVHDALTKIFTGKVEQPLLERREPAAVPVKKSVTPDFIISLEDGKKYKVVKAPSLDILRPFSRSVPRKVGFAEGLSNGRAELCSRAIPFGQGDRARGSSNSEIGDKSRGEQGRPASQTRPSGKNVEEGRLNLKTLYLLC